MLSFSDDGGFANSGNLALSLSLSLFPFMLVIATIADIWGDPKLLEEILQLVFSHWPAGSAAPIAEQIKVVLSRGGGELFSLGTVVALVLATNGVESARDGLNRAYNFSEDRSFFWRRAQGVLFVVIGALGLMVTAFILVATPLVWNFLVTQMSWLEQFSFTVTVVKLVIAFAILVLTQFAFHYFLPSGRLEFMQVVWGILLTIVGIIIGSQLFALYLTTFANYTALYAGLAGVMIAVVYLYYLSVLVLFGAEFNAALMKAKLAKQST